MVLVGDASVVVLVVILVAILVAVLVAVATAVASVSPAFLSRCFAEKTGGATGRKEEIWCRRPKERAIKDD